MKIKSLLLVAFVVITNTLSANTKPINPSEMRHSISKEVSNLLKNPKFEIDSTIRANVFLTVNEKNELVVLSVNTTDAVIENYIKTRLNYAKLKTAVSKDVRLKTFSLPFKMIK